MCYDLTSFLNDEQFAVRLAHLRIRHNISARDMSLQLGKNPKYINHIENNYAYPTMKMFFYICELLRITPKQFFDLGMDNPARLNDLINHAHGLSPEAIEVLVLITSSLK